ncbi:MAG: MaoC family dehydratase [Dehalococcoidia bacterium]
MSQNPPLAQVGEEAVFSKIVTAQDVEALVAATGDRNPLHLDAAFAARTRFGRTVAHGVLTMGLISAAVSGFFVKRNVNVILVGANHRFRAPVYMGDTVTARGRVRNFDPNRSLVFLDTECTNQKDEVLITGEVVIMLEVLADS